MENTNLKISVIVPVYNAEKYLQRCIDSILTQTFIDFELLLIDDGSKDKSGEICDEYANRDNRVKVFHKENGGASSARNLGLDYANGKYVVFVDSDDYISASYLDCFYQILLKYNDVDLIIQSPIYTSTNGALKSREIPSKVYDGVNILSDFVTDGNLDFTEPHSKLFRLNLIQENNIRFNEKVIVGEDGIFIACFLRYCKMIISSEDVGYHYVKSDMSIQRRFYAPEKELLGVVEWKKALMSLAEFAGIDRTSPNIWKVLTFLIKRYLFAVVKNTTLSYKDKEKWIKSLDKDCFLNYGKGCSLNVLGYLFSVVVRMRFICLIIIMVKFK